MIKRREFITGLGGNLITGMVTGYNPHWQRQTRQGKLVETRGTAKNVIFILLSGGPSHVDMFDLKLGSYSPDALGPATIGGSLLWPQGIMPKLAKRANQFSLVRSISAVEAVHERAIYHLITSRRPNPSLTQEIPHFESVVSHMLDPQRSEHATLPTVISSGRTVFNGFFDIVHRGLALGEEGRIVNNIHDFDGADDRFGLLGNLLGGVPLRDGGRGDFVRLHEQAREIMTNPTLNEILGGSDDSDDEYTPARNFMNQCQVAARAILAGLGTRVFSIDYGSWDHHDQIYSDAAYSHMSMARGLDDGLAHLLDTLGGAPGESAGKTMLDETLIVAVGEFGRTTGALNSSFGRDHFPYVLPAFFAGGGIAGGRVLGRSDGEGEVITDAGWSHGRYVTVADVIATIYSALGIDWTERFLDTPSGRAFELVDSSGIGQAHEIDGLFV